MLFVSAPTRRRRPEWQLLEQLHQSQPGRYAASGARAAAVGQPAEMVLTVPQLIDACVELQKLKRELLMDEDPQQETSTRSPAATHYGCTHYKRKAKLVAPCCSKVYSCRFCHDDLEQHQMDRKSVTLVECAACGHRQSPQQTCAGCDVLLAKYFCSICNLYDDELKSQYHCDGCGICRVGGRESFYHCVRCDMCLPKNLEGNHKCVEKVSRTNCAVCMEDIHTSRVSSHIPPCGHMIHKPCFRRLVDRGYYACPICSVTMFKMDSVWTKLDIEVAETQMPRRYRNCYARILCNDCHSKTMTKFHVIGLKCGGCGSYNTARSEGPLYKRTAKGDLVPFSELDDDSEEDEELEADGATEDSTEDEVGGSAEDDIGGSTEQRTDSPASGAEEAPVDTDQGDTTMH